MDLKSSSIWLPSREVMKHSGLNVNQVCRAYSLGDSTHMEFTEHQGSGPDLTSESDGEHGLVNFSRAQLPYFTFLFPSLAVLTIQSTVSHQLTKTRTPELHPSNDNPLI